LGRGPTWEHCGRARPPQRPVGGLRSPSSSSRDFRERNLLSSTADRWRGRPYEADLSAWSAPQRRLSGRVRTPQRRRCRGCLLSALVPRAALADRVTSVSTPPALPSVSGQSARTTVRAMEPSKTDWLFSQSTPPLCSARRAGLVHGGSVEVCVSARTAEQSRWALPLPRLNRKDLGLDFHRDWTVSTVRRGRTRTPGRTWVRTSGGEGRQSVFLRL